MKNFRAALAFLALVGVTQAEPTHTWWDGTSSSMNVKASSTGTWTIGMNLNVDALMSFGQGGSRAQSTYGDDYSKAGNELFSVKGDGSYQGRGTGFLDTSIERREYNDRNVTITMGWGGNWYTNVSSADNSVPEGLQLGVTSTGDAKDLSGGGYASGIGGFFTGDKGFEVYVADMKQQYGVDGGVHDGKDGSYDWSIDETTIDETKKAAATTLDAIAKMTQIDKATLFVEHTYAGGPSDQLVTDDDRDYASDSGDYKKNVTYTTFYLTVTGILDGKEVTINFMGQNDDASDNGLGGKEGQLLGGSCWYDVDFVEQIEGINGEFVDSLVFVNSAMTSAQREQLMTNGLPEPTTVTLSLMALAGLAARRRRR